MPERIFNPINLPNIVDETWQNIELSHAGHIRTEDIEENRRAFEKPLEAPEPAKSYRTTTNPHETKGKTTRSVHLLDISGDSMYITLLDNALSLTTSDTAVDAPPLPYGIQLIPLPSISAINKQPTFKFDALLNQDKVMGEAEVAADNGEQTEESTSAISEREFADIDADNVATRVE